MNAAAAGSALAAALCYAIAAALQHKAAQREPTLKTLDPRLLLRLLRNPLWIGGAVVDLTGAGLHGLALAWGPLSLVQPLLVSGLILAVPLEATLEHVKPSRRDLAGVCLGSLGLATFVIVAAPTSGADPADAPMLAVVGGVGLLVTALVATALATTGPRRATLLGIAAGASYALAATLAKACIDRAGGEDPWSVFADWRLYVLAVVGIVGVVLNQNAFQAGTLAGPLTGIVLTDPLVSVAIAVSAYEEHISTGGLATVVEILALIVMGIGVWLVSSRQGTVESVA